MTRFKTPLSAEAQGIPLAVVLTGTDRHDSGRGYPTHQRQACQTNGEASCRSRRQGYDHDNNGVHYTLPHCDGNRLAWAASRQRAGYACWVPVKACARYLRDSAIAVLA